MASRLGDGPSARPPGPVLSPKPDPAWAAARALGDGYALYRSGRRDAAVAKFREVVRDHPGTRAAKEAEQMIERLSPQR